MARGRVIDTTDRDQDASGRGFGVPSRARSLNDARACREASRASAARHRRGHLARDHFHLRLSRRLPPSIHVDVSGGDAAMQIRRAFSISASQLHARRIWGLARSSARLPNRSVISACSRSTGAQGRRLVDEARAAGRARSSPGCRSWSAPTTQRGSPCSSSQNRWSTGGARGRARVGHARPLAARDSRGWARSEPK